MTRKNQHAEKVPVGRGAREGRHDDGQTFAVSKNLVAGHVGFGIGFGFGLGGRGRAEAWVFR
jgi:hypothetical protein